MKRVLVLFVLVVVVWISVAASAAPRITVDSATYDFPATVEGIAVPHTFVLSNIGDQELVITSVGPSCKCTKITTALATSRLLPGESADLYALLDTCDLSGRVVKQAIVISNDPGSDGDYSLTLSFTGTIVAKQPHQESVGELFRQSYLLLDVRDPSSYDASHLVGAKSLPASQLAALASGLPAGVLTIFYDEHGESANLTAITETLHAAGIPDVYALTGGFSQWQSSYGSSRVASGEDTSWGPFVDVSGARSPAGSTQVAKYYVAQLRTDYVLIDIRSAATFASGHLAGAVNLLEAELAAYIGALPRETPVIVYSQDGTDSDRVVRDLWTQGSRARSLLGGLAQWRQLYADFLLVESAS